MRWMPTRSTQGSYACRSLASTGARAPFPYRRRLRALEAVLRAFAGRSGVILAASNGRNPGRLAIGGFDDSDGSSVGPEMTGLDQGLKCWTAQRRV